MVCEQHELISGWGTGKAGGQWCKILGVTLTPFSLTQESTSAGHQQEWDA